MASRKPTKRRRGADGTVARYRGLGQVLALIRLLSAGRWRVADLCDELSVQWRTVYRLLEVLRAAGIVVERHPEGSTVYLRIRRAQARRALGLE